MTFKVKMYSVSGGVGILDEGVQEQLGGVVVRKGAVPNAQTQSSQLLAARGHTSSL